MAQAHRLLAQGRRVVVKDAFGVSGKGLAVIEEPRRLERLHQMLVRRRRSAGDDRFSLVVEEWVAKRNDLNYQLTIGRDGSCRFDSVKEAITGRGVHKGHCIPASLAQAQRDELAATSTALAHRLAADGYHGVVGVDAMTDPDGQILPVTEINARHNMSTYQIRMQEMFMAPGQVALARLYPLRLTHPLAYRQVRRLLEDLMVTQPGHTGLLVTNVGTVNAATPIGPSAGFDGRLYGLLIATDRRQLADLDRQVATRLLRAEGRTP